MPTTITQPATSRRKYPLNPERDGMLSLDPADWWMYCDRLQDAGAPAARWRWAKRVGDSLHAEPRLLLYTVNGYYYPRIVSHARYACISESSPPTVRTGTPYPVWVKPAHVHLLRWYESKGMNELIVKSEFPGILPEIMEDAFTPDCLPGNPYVLALYRYACDYGRRNGFHRWDEADFRTEFVACHGRLNVEGELDARKEWHV